MTEMPTADKTVDARGLMCPMPILQAKKEIKTMEVGQILEVLSGDEGSKEDFPRWATRTGNEFLGIFDNGEGFARYFIKKSA
ncbi:MAG TPA: sulfurtransferase TusA family protein [Candidatus Glassbacteria bacterium]|nr:sulfurtransferase TusA family protein [Candidatus Glassbacteria bacterium]